MGMYIEQGDEGPGLLLMLHGKGATGRGPVHPCP